MLGAVPGGLDPRALKPILNEAEGFYQIGPRDKCSEHFVLSVTIAFATNLPQVRWPRCKNSCVCLCVCVCECVCAGVCACVCMTVCVCVARTHESNLCVTPQGQSLPNLCVTPHGLSLQLLTTQTSSENSLIPNVHVWFCRTSDHSYSREHNFGTKRCVYCTSTIQALCTSHGTVM